MFVLVSYDIVDDKSRSHVARLLEDYGRRVQKSVFEMTIDESVLIDIRQKIEAMVDARVDSVRYYVLCQRCVYAVEVYGVGTVTEDGSDAVIVI